VRTLKILGSLHCIYNTKGRIKTGLFGYELTVEVSQSRKMEIAKARLLSLAMGIDLCTSKAGTANINPL
jgi:hypothetical protein